MLRKSVAKINSVDLGTDGILRIQAKFARIGTMTYYGDGSMHDELISEETLSNVAREFNMMPVTIDHEQGMVTKDNRENVIRGLSGNDCRYEDGWLTGTLAITEQDAIDKALTTHGYISIGYYADMRVNDTNEKWLDESGVMGVAGNEYSYAYEQITLLANHITLTDAPRAGKEAKLVFNSDETISAKLNSSIKEKQINNTTDIKPMIKLEVNGESIEVTEDNLPTVQDKINALTAPVEAPKVEVINTEALQASLDVKDAEIDSLKAVNNSLTEQLADKSKAQLSEEKINSEIEIRLALWEVAQPVLKLEKINTAWNQKQIKQNALCALLPNLSEKINAATDVYVDALWDAQSDLMAAKSEVVNTEDEEKEEPSIKEEKTEDVIKTEVQNSSQAKKNSWFERKMQQRNKLMNRN